jgi:hypothetical protein
MMLATDRANTGRSLMLTNGCQVLSNQPQLHVTDRGEIDHRTGPTQVNKGCRNETSVRLRGETGTKRSSLNR